MQTLTYDGGDEMGPPAIGNFSTPYGFSAMLFQSQLHSARVRVYVHRKLAHHRLPNVCKILK